MRGDETPGLPLQRAEDVQGARVSEKQYYQWRIQEEHRNGRRLEERELVQRVEEAFHASDDAYGCRKITRVLRNEGIAVSEWKVRRIMREHGLYSVTQKKYRLSAIIKKRILTSKTS